MTWSFTYRFTEEDTGESEPANFEAELTETEEAALKAAVEAGRTLKEERALQDLIWRTYDDVRRKLIAELRDAGDEYTLICLQNNADPFDYAYTLRVDIYDPSCSGDEGEANYWF